MLTSTGESTPDTYGAGKKIRVTVTFSEAVTVTGEPHFDPSDAARTNEAEEPEEEPAGNRPGPLRTYGPNPRPGAATCRSVAPPRSVSAPTGIRR